MADKTKYQKWTHKIIHRSQITEAPYNPREITQEAYDGLSAGMQQHGQVIPLVWNEKSGNLVSGHQRLAISDEKNGQDYHLTVLAVSLDDKKERRANLILNNQSAQGRYDIVMLGALMRETGLDGTGFTPETVSLHIPPSDADAIFGRKPAAKPAPLPPAPVTEEVPLMIVFQSRAASDGFAERWGLDPNNRYAKGDVLLKLAEALIGS